MQLVAVLIEIEEDGEADAIKMEINCKELIDALLYKKKLSIMEDASKSPVEVEFQEEVDQGRDGRLGRMISNVAKRLPREGLRLCKMEIGSSGLA